jgi:hypothetical protein
MLKAVLRVQSEVLAQVCDLKTLAEFMFAKDRVYFASMRRKLLKKVSFTSPCRSPNGDPLLTAMPYQSGLKADWRKKERFQIAYLHSLVADQME